MKQQKARGKRKVERNVKGNMKQQEARGKRKVERNVKGNMQGSRRLEKCGESCAGKCAGKQRVNHMTQS